MGHVRKAPDASAWTLEELDLYHPRFDAEAAAEPCLGGSLALGFKEDHP